MDNELFGSNLLGCFFAMLFNPGCNVDGLPPLPMIDEKLFQSAGEEEKSELTHKVIDSDPFWGKFFKKMNDKEQMSVLSEAIKEVDEKISSLTKERFNIIKKWVNEEL